MLPHKSLITITLLAKIKIDTVLIHSTHQNIEMSEYLELSQVDGRFAVRLRCVLQMTNGPEKHADSHKISNNKSKTSRSCCSAYAFAT